MRDPDKPDLGFLAFAFMLTLFGLAMLIFNF